MEYTKEVLLEMKQKKALYNKKFSTWYYRKYKENGGIIKKIKQDSKIILLPSGDIPSSDFNKGQRISSCCDLWLWDLYEKNKLMDLKKLNRCKNSRFCPNCKKINIAKFIHEFKAKIPILENYDFYLLTLTIPSEKTDGEGLKILIDKLTSVFQRLNRKFSADLFTPSGKRSSQALQERFLCFSGGVRVLEITYNKQNGFHPHLHCVVCVPKNSIKFVHLEKNKTGKWSKKRNSINLKSDIDLQIGKVWSMLWYGIDFRKWDSLEYSASDTYIKIDDELTDFKNLEVDFKLMDDRGILEVIKYTFKSSDVATYNIFKALNIALEYKRIRQGFGVLHNLKCDDDQEGELQDLVLEIEEEPIEILTREFDELISVFADYRKISRFNPNIKNEFLSIIAD